MFKCIALLKRKPGLSREAFIDYYETRHAVLMRGLMPEAIGYRRNFVERDGLFEFGGAAPIDFDVITEIWFEDRAAYDRFIDRASEPDVAKAIADDEENLFDRSASRMMIVEERGTPPEHRGQPA